MFKTLVNAFKVKDLRKKILITLLLLLVYRIGCAVVCPGINLGETIRAEVESNSYSFFSLMNLMSGNALSNGSILALGVSPYITASIVIQLLSVAIPALERISQSGEDGKRKINLYTRITALVLAVAQAIGVVITYSSQLDDTALGLPIWLIGCGVVLILTAGAMFTVWIGEKITEKGVGNGMSLLIFVGILSSASSGLANAFRQVGTNIEYLWTIIIFIVALILIFGLIVFADSAERRIPIQYAKQIKGRKMYGGQSTYIPIKIIGTGVMPIIFASALLTLPQMIMSIFNVDMTWWQTWLGTDSWLYIVLLAVLIFAFSFFYAQIMFNPDDVSRRIQQQGGFIPGIRAGKPTAEYLKKISRRVTLFGAFFLAIIALLPSIAFKLVDTFDTTTYSLINAFSATGLMIIVSVALETNKQIEAQMLMRNYKGFLD